MHVSQLFICVLCSARMRVCSFCGAFALFLEFAHFCGGYLRLFGSKYGGSYIQSLTASCHVWRWSCLGAKQIQAVLTGLRLGAIDGGWSQPSGWQNQRPQSQVQPIGGTCIVCPPMCIKLPAWAKPGLRQKSDALHQRDSNLQPSICGYISSIARKFPEWRANLECANMSLIQTDLGKDVAKRRNCKLNNRF